MKRDVTCGEGGWYWEMAGGRVNAFGGAGLRKLAVRRMKTHLFLLVVCRIIYACMYVLSHTLILLSRPIRVLQYAEVRC